MSQFKVTAIVDAEDHASAVIAAMVSKARSAGGELSGISARGMSDAQATTRAHLAALDAQRQQLAAYKAEALSAFGGIAAHGVHAMMEIGGEMERTQRRMAAFTNASKEQLAAIRREADTDGAGLKGGPEGFFEGARAAAMSGVKPEQAGIVAKYGAVFADETGEDNAAATEKLVQHVSMLQHLRDEAGKPITFAEANNEQVDRALRETMNLLIAINKIAPGNIGQVFEGFKFAGPTTLGLGRDANETAALYTVLARHGIVGSEAGNTIKSSLARLLSPTAKARQAIATGGLNYGEYIHADPDVVSAEGIEKGVALRLGKLNDATKAGIAKAVEHFKSGTHDLDAFNQALTDTFVASGAKGMNDRLKAGNVARDTIANFAATADLPAFLRDAHNKGLGVGFLDAIFGQQQGGRLAAVSGQEILDTRKLYDTETQKDNVGTAMRERAESYDGMRDRFLGALKGLEDQLFQAGIKQPATVGFDVGADALEGIARAPERVKAWLAEMTAATAVIGGSAAATTLTRIAGALTGIAAPTEGAIGGLLRLAGIIGRFSTLGTVGGALAGVQIGNVLGEAASTLGEVIRGKYYTPSTPEDFNAVSAERDQLKAEIARRRAAIFDPNAHDPEVKRLEGEVAAAKARQAQPDMANPELARREAELAALKARKPPEDPEVPRLEAKLSELERKMGTPAEGGRPALPPAAPPREAMLRTIIERREHLDPQDPGLPQLRVQLEKMQADHQRDNIDRTGEPEALRADIARRRADALAAQEAEIERKTLELHDFQARLTMSPDGLRKDVEEAQGRLDARKAENARLNIFSDPAIGPLEDRVLGLEGRMQAYTRAYKPNPFLTAAEPEMHQGPAYPVPEVAPLPGNPFLAAGAPATGPFHVDVDLAALAKATGGLNGADIGAQLRAALTGLPPAKVDPVRVSGTVTGQAEVATRIVVEVKPTAALQSAMATAQHVARMRLDGKMGDSGMGGDDEMGVRAPWPAGTGLI